jgi:mRNA interferase MazF
VAAGDVYKIYVAYDKKSNDGKERYVVQLGKTQIEIGVSMSSITSQYDKKSELIKAQYYEIQDWQQAGLKKKSYVDIRNKTTFPVVQVMLLGKSVGKLTANDMLGLLDFIKSYPSRVQALKNQDKTA